MPHLSGVVRNEAKLERNSYSSLWAILFIPNIDDATVWLDVRKQMRGMLSDGSMSEPSEVAPDLASPLSISIRGLRRTNGA